MDFEPKTAQEEAGLALIQDDRFHYRFTVSLKKDSRIVTLVRCSNHEETILGEAPVSRNGRIYLTVTATEEGYHFYYGSDDQELLPLCLKVDPTLLSSLVNEGFTGTYIGMYASSNRTESANYADYDWVIYEGIR